MAIKRKFSNNPVWYVPKHEGNREDKDPTMFKIKPMKSKVYRRYINNVMAGSMSISKENAEISVDNLDSEALAEIRNKALKEVIKEVHNYYDFNIETDEQELIEDVDYIIENSDEELLEELMLAAIDMSKLTEGLKKT